MNESFYLQLHSVREALSADFDGTLREIAEMGYDGVELCMNYGGYSGEELAHKLDFYGLSAISAHLSLDEMQNNFEYHADILTACGCQNVVCSYLDCNDEQKAQKYARVLDELSISCAMHNFSLAYHNHDGDYEKAENGEYIYDILLEQCPLVLAQPDIYWQRFKGADEIAQIRKYAGRIDSVHLKQLKDGQCALFSDGEIDIAAAIKAGKLAGAQYFIVELQKPNIMSELEDARDNLAFLKKIKL